MSSRKHINKRGGALMVLLRARGPVGADSISALFGPVWLPEQSVTLKMMALNVIIKI